MSNEDYFNELTKPSPEDEVECRIRAWAAKWANLLGLGHYCIQLWFSHEGVDGITATTSTRWEYLTAKITFNLPQCMQFADNDAVLENVVIHELLHVVVAEISQTQGRNPGVEHEERVVSHLALAFQRVQTRSTSQVPPD
jgi:hypothetical protein